MVAEVIELQGTLRDAQASKCVESPARSPPLRAASSTYVEALVISETSVAGTMASNARAATAAAGVNGQGLLGNPPPVAAR